MNRFVKTALAVAVVGSAANAGTGDNDWAALDSEISGLASSLKPSSDSQGWSVLLRAVYSHSSDDIATGGGGSPDTSGFNFNDVDAALWGASGPYRWRLSFDIDDNDAGSGGTGLVLEDAYVALDCGGYFDAMMGQFKPHFTNSNSVDPEKQVLIDRTVLGSALDRWDDGIGITGTMDLFAWWFQLLDGQNGHEKSHLYLLRGEFRLGSGAGDYEGALGSSDQINATFGLSFVHDDTNGDTDGDGDTDNTSVIFDANGSVSNFGFGFEVAKLDDDTGLSTSSDYNNIFDNGTGSPSLMLVGDSMPWSLTGSYLATPEWEVAARYENLDNGESNGPDNTVLSFGVNWHRGSGGRWQAQYTMIDADNPFFEGDVFEVGYSIGSSR